MAGLFVSSKSQATRHGVYAIRKTSPAVVKATGFGTAAIVEKFSWGPSQTLTSPTSVADLLLTIAPPGMTRTDPGYMAVTNKAFPFLKYVRVLGSTAIKAFATINKTGPTALIVVTLKYEGTEGNAVVITIGAASDGDANHFNITATVTGASGTTTDLIENYNVSGTGADSSLSTTDLAKLRLIGAVTKSSAGLPILGSTTCTGGTNGTIDATTYVGTIGTGDKGLAKLEGSKAIDHVFFGDPGNSLRAAANAGMKAHVDARTDRIGYINGDSGMTAAAAQTDVANYRSRNLMYCDPYVYVFDDVTGAKTLVTSASFAGAISSQLSPSTSIAWKNAEAVAILGGIVDLEADRGDASATNTAAGISTFMREEEGGYTIEAAVVTIAPSSPADADHTSTRMGIYIARSVTKSLRPLIDAPNVPANQQDGVDAITTFMEVLKGNAGRDPNHTPHVIDYAIGDLGNENPDVEIAAGDYSIPLASTFSSGMKRIFLVFDGSPFVKIRTAT